MNRNSALFTVELDDDDDDDETPTSGPLKLYDERTGAKQIT